MKVAELLEQRRERWLELDQLCLQLDSKRKDPRAVSRFVSLYRAACADLALADAYQLPPNTVQYLHQLVGRAHNQLYRSRPFDYRVWRQTLLVDVPQRLLRDRCVQTAFVLFWATFIGSGMMAYYQPDWGPQVMPAEMIEQLEANFSTPLEGRGAEMDYTMAAFYIWNNTSIGLRCFVFGILVVPGLFETLHNSLILGAAFGYMGRPDIPQGANFFNFVTAHGPFELTAIVLAAGAGLRLGMGWIHTRGLTRVASLQQNAREAMPVMGISMLLFFFAAMIEGFVSPTALPYPFKAGVGIITAGVLAFYCLFLGFPRGSK
ncbi:MAG: stage II sporulation protein M [Planctomycetota bacterium]